MSIASEKSAHRDAASTSPAGRSPWRWLPSLYVAQSIPLALAMTLSVVFYKRMEVSNTDIALYTSWLYLPWVIKPLWSPLVELLGSKRRWIVAMQVLIGSTLALVALAVPLPGFFQWTLVVFWLMAFAAATHDIAADGFYMLVLDERRQAAFVGVRSACFRVGTLAAQGGLVMLAGRLEARLADVQTAWAIVFGVTGVLFGLLALWHARCLPKPAADASRVAHPGPPSLRQMAAVFAAFFHRPGLAHLLAFLLLYRLAEAQALKLVPPFLLDPAARGGLGLSTEQVGWAYGTVGVLCLTAGGLAGGWWIAQRGLARCLWAMVLVMHLPNLLFVALAWVGMNGGINGGVPLALVTGALAVEQFGYGFGFAAYLVYLLWVAAGPAGDNPHRTAHYAIGTGFMALGMMLPGMWSGWLQAQLGYFNFFALACACALPSLWLVATTRLDPAFGRRGD